MYGSAGCSSARLYERSAIIAELLAALNARGGCNYEVGRQRRARKRKKERERRKSLSASPIVKTLSSPCATVMPNQHCVLDGKRFDCVFSYLPRRRGSGWGERLYCIEQYSGLFFFPVCLSAAFKYERSSIEAAHERLINGAVFRCLFYAKPPALHSRGLH